MVFNVQTNFEWILAYNWLLCNYLEQKVIKIWYMRRVIIYNHQIPYARLPAQDEHTSSVFTQQLFEICLPLGTIFVFIITHTHMDIYIYIFV